MTATSTRLARGLAAAALAAVAAVAGLGACSASSTLDEAPTAQPPVPTATLSIESEGGLEAILATTDFAPGPNRFSFLLLTPRALVTVPRVSVAARAVSADGSVETVAAAVGDAEYYGWPYGTRGSYVTELDFPQTGRWLVRAEVEDPDLGPLSVGIPVQVDARTTVPAVGATAPPTANKTAGAVESLAVLTTGSNPDPALYRLTVDEAVANGLPTVVVFASPSLCTSPSCGPQVETVSGLATTHDGVVNFIHIEVYDNPDEIQGDLSRGRYAAPVAEWGLSSLEDYLNESWVFILEPGGRIAARFEGYATEAELTAALTPYL